MFGAQRENRVADEVQFNPEKCHEEEESDNETDIDIGLFPSNDNGLVPGKLTRTSAFTPVKQPRGSKCANFSRGVRRWFSSSKGRVGITTKASTVRNASAIAALQYAHGHQVSAKAPPVAKPPIAPKGAIPPNSARAMFFFRPGAHDWPRMARPLGKVKEGPVPWKTRAKINRTWFE